MSPRLSLKAPPCLSTSGRVMSSCRAESGWPRQEGTPARHRRFYTIFPAAVGVEGQGQNCPTKIQRHGSFQRQFFKLEHCWELLKKYEIWELIEKQSPPKRGSLTTMGDDEDDDGPRNLNKLDEDKKSRETKREHEASSLHDKIDVMVQSNELILAKTLEAKKELVEKKAREKQEKVVIAQGRGVVQGTH
ncbi:Lactation elevated protein 1 [Hordeum vulgare]|nr:Lactation elevated protein 1 [Hordeum vulgare]